MTVAIPRMPQPTEDELDRLREWIDRPLPKNYVDFVNLYDGADPGSNAVSTLDNETSVRCFIPVRETVALGSSIAGFPLRVIPLAEDGSGNYFYVKADDGAVYFWDHEVDGPDERIAEGATSFLDKLNHFDPSSVMLAPGQVRSAWINPAFVAELRASGKA